MLLLQPVFMQAQAQNTNSRFSADLNFNTSFIFRNIANFRDTGCPEFQFFLPLQQESVLFHKHGFSWYSKNIKTNRNEFTTIEFKNSNPNVIIEALKPATQNFTFDTLRQEFQGYQQLIYHNIYPKIDWIIEIDLNNPTGFKYSWRLLPGANPNYIQYQSNNSYIMQENSKLLFISNSDTLVDGNLSIKTHKNTVIKGRFIKNNKLIGIQFLEPTSPSDTIIIDPWVSRIRNLTRVRKKEKAVSENIGSDLDFDYENNVYVYGGQALGVSSYDTSINFSCFKVAKYNNSGNLDWIFSGDIVGPGFSPSNSYEVASNILCDKSSGKIYVGCSNMNQTAGRVIRLNANGLYDNLELDTSKRMITVRELLFDPSNDGTLAVFGENQTFWGDSIELNIKTEGKPSIDLSITGKIHPVKKNVTTAAQDYSGYSYAVVSAFYPDTSINPYIHSLNYNFRGSRFISKHGLPIDTYSYYWPRARFTKNAGAFFTNASNGLASNDDYICYFDGSRVSAIDKQTRKFNKNTYSIKNAFVGFASGIATDACNRVFVAGDSGNIYCLRFNGIDFKLDSQLYVWGQKKRCTLYDIRYNPSTGTLFATGDSFVASFHTPLPCRDSTLDIQRNPICGSILYAILQNPDTLSTYTFDWFDSTDNKSVQRNQIKGKYSDTFSSAKPLHRYKLRIYRNQRIGGYYREYPFKVLPKFDTLIQITLCEGDTFYHFGNTHTQSITLEDTFQNIYGCDSTQQIKLTVLPRYIKSDTLQGCTGDTFILFGKNQTSSGIYIDSLKTYQGCDSIIRTVLIIHTDTVITKQFRLCVGDSIFIANRWITKSDSGTDSFQRFTGCDSIIHWKVTVNPTSHTKLQKHLCQNDTFLWSNKFYADSGTFTEIYKNQFGCDSVTTLVITKSNFQTSFSIDSTGKPTLQLSRNTNLQSNNGSWTWWGDNRAKGNQDTAVFVWNPDNQWHKMKLVDIDSWGCKDSTEAHFFSPKNSIELYNSFTPNGDGLNDKFAFESTGTNFLYSFYIYNRWGELVYFTENASIQDSSKYWNGNVNNGSIVCSEGTYFGQFYTQFSTTVQPIDSPIPQNRSFSKPISVVITLIR